MTPPAEPETIEATHPVARPAHMLAILADPPIRATLVSTFVMMVGFGAIAPVLPLFARSLGAGYGGAGLLITCYGGARLAVDLFAGPLVDRHGERRCAIGGLIVVALSALGTGAAPSFGIAVVAWSLGGAGSAVVFAANYSLLLRRVPKSHTARTLGIFYGSLNLGVIAGGLLGGGLADRFGLASPLFADAGLVALAVVVYAYSVRSFDGARTSSPRLSREVVKSLLRLKGLPAVLVLNLGYLWMVAAVFDTLIPLFARDELGASPANIGTVFAVALATEFLVLYPAGRIADRVGRKVVVVPALAALATAIVILAWAPGLTWLAILMGFLGIASGVAGVPPAAMLSDIVPEERSGLGVGLFRFCGDLGLALGPVIVGSTTGVFGFKIGFAVAAAPIALSLLLTARMQETLPAKAAAAR